MYKVTIFLVKNPNLLSPTEVPGTCDQWALQVSGQVQWRCAISMSYTQATNNL